MKADLGQNVYASGAGTARVYSNRTRCRGGGFGRAVVVDHGRYGRSLYAHLSRITIRNGQHVTPDTVIGKAGGTGLTDRCGNVHLHYEETTAGFGSRGRPRNPGKFKACSAGKLVRYPNAWRRSSWDRLPGHRYTASNSGRECVASSQPDPPATSSKTRRGTDFNGDGRDDVFWYGPGAAYDSLHYGAGRGKFTIASVRVDGDYSPVAGDFDGDGRDDIFWYGPASAPDASWYGGTIKGNFASVPASVKGTYRPFTGDFNGDGRDDVFWYGPGAAYDSLHYGAGRGKFTIASVRVDGDYTPVVGDFDGDKRSDILWYRPGAAPDASWYGGTIEGNFASVPASVKGTYRPFTGDFNGDGRDDVFWYGPGAAYDSLHYGAGRGKFTTATTKVHGQYSPIVGDFDGDGHSDILWYGPGSAPDTSWYGATKKGSFTSVPASVTGTYRPLQ